jgi:hypothetical protein
MTCLLGVFVLWQIVEHAVPPSGSTVVHVTERDVDIFIDGTPYHVRGYRGAPIVTTLRPGRHTLRMSRKGRVLYDEPFEIGRRDDGIVLTAWDKTRPVDPGPPVTTVSLQHTDSKKQRHRSIAGLQQ